MLILLFLFPQSMWHFSAGDNVRIRTETRRQEAYTKKNTNKHIQTNATNRHIEENTTNKHKQIHRKKHYKPTHTNNAKATSPLLCTARPTRTSSHALSSILNTHLHPAQWTVGKRYDTIVESPLEKRHGFLPDPTNL